MNFPKNILVIGEGHFINSLYKVLTLFGSNCHNYSFTSLSSVKTDTFKRNYEIHTRFKKYLYKCALLLLIADQKVTPIRLIHLVHFLRSDLVWEGIFLAVLRSEDEKKQLSKMTLTGDKDEKFSFRNIHGHAALCQPLLLGDLIRMLSELKKMYSEVWFNLLNISHFQALKRKISEAEQLLKEKKVRKAVNIVINIIEGMKQIDWQLILLSHRDYYLVKNLIKHYSQGNFKQNRCFRIIKEIRAIFSKCCIGG